MRTCPYCKKEVLESDKFCGWCGQKLPIESTKEEKKVVEKIKEKARTEELKRKEDREEEREKKTTDLIKEKAKKEAEEIKETKSKREQIIEKLTKVSSEEEEKRKRFLRTLGIKKAKPSQVPPSPPKVKRKEVIFRPVLQTKPSPFEKIWIRILILILIFSIISAILVFGFDVLGLREKPPVIVTPTEPETPEEPEEKPEELTIPPALLSVENTFTLEISSLNELPPAFSSFLKSGLPEEVFARILIKNLEENKIVNLEEFLKGLGIEPPEWLFQKVKLDFTLLAYAPQNYQIGFITELKEPLSLIEKTWEREKTKEELENLFISWEKTMKGDFDPLFLLFGKEKLMVSHPFKADVRSGENFRYISFYQENFGMAYGLIKDYFIFTTSHESMLELVDHKVELTKDLKRGDRGTEVEILQNWLAKDIKIYPEGLVTGYYGILTHSAVIRFQQKYSEEILRPWGLVEGTGRVDEITRKKLNEVYRR